MSQSNANELPAPRRPIVNDDGSLSWPKRDHPIPHPAEPPLAVDREQGQDGGRGRIKKGGVPAHKSKSDARRPAAAPVHYDDPADIKDPRRRGGFIESLPPEERARIHPDDARWTTLEWYINATDEKGHAAKLSVRVPPSLASDLEILVQSKQFSYKTVEDLIRHAVFRHACWLHDIKPLINQQMFSTAYAAIYTLSMEHQEVVLRELLENMTERVVAHINDGVVEEAKRASAIIYSLISQSGPKNSSFRKKFTKRFADVQKMIETAEAAQKTKGGPLHNVAEMPLALPHTSFDRIHAKRDLAMREMEEDE